MTLHQNLSEFSLAPSYRTVDPNSTSSNGSSPHSHRVGKISNVHFVTPSLLHRHLRLLGAFDSLRRKVEAVEFGSVSDSRAKWTVFAHLASYRYELYVKEIVARGSGTVTLPPLDVAMVFHTHLLNPTIFAEDKLRTLPELELLSNRLLTEFVDVISPETLEPSPSDEEISNWQTRTSLPYDSLQAFSSSDGRTIVDPFTGEEIHVPWINPDGTGFAQEGFQATSTAGNIIRHETLGIAKLSRDIFDMKEGKSQRGLARTHLNAHNALKPLQSSLALSLSSKLVDLPTVSNASCWQEIGNGLDWKRENAFKVVAHGAGGTKYFRKINDILEGYTTGSPFSLDLAMATIRQSNFVEKMRDLGWTSREWLSTLPEENEILIRCVARYHAFMDLLSSSFSLFAVPTLDIDLAWHTHQLQSTYRTDTAKAVGRAIDHDDKVEETDLGFGFDDTARLWEERFKVPYHYCGCAQPPSKGLAKLGAKFSRSSNSTPSSSELEQISDAHPATHSSEHNSFILTHHPDAQQRRKNRSNEFGDRKKKEDKKREKELKKGQLSAEEAESERRKLEHAQFFLAPIPMFEMSGEEGHPVSKEGVPISANQTGTNKAKGSCGGSAGDGIAASVGSCGAASGVYLVAGPSGGGNLASSAGGFAHAGVASSMGIGGLDNSFVRFYLHLNFPIPYKMSSKEKREQFLSVWPALSDELVDYAKGEKMPKDAVEWFKRNLDHNTPGGKLNRGISVVDTVEIIKGSKLTEEEYRKAAILGWCIELLQAYFLVADDMMDQSVTRRGQPCWYRVESVGNIAINDSFMLEAAIYYLLKKHFRQEKYYVDLMELFHETTFQTELGQLIDLITAPEDSVDLSKFSLEKHHLIVVYKTAYYSFYLPVALALHMSGVTSPSAFQKSLDILIPMGEYFQVQDDYLDCYGTPEQIGKIGTDILDNKCSWLINVALKKASTEQRKVLDENYGVKNSESEAKIKAVYKELELARQFQEYEASSYEQLNKLINEIPEGGSEDGLKREIFQSFLAKVYKRQK
ncbi:hypothetical protein JCM3765_005383 [Sporobolomyces pararoseus]